MSEGTVLFCLLSRVPSIMCSHKGSMFASYALPLNTSHIVKREAKNSRMDEKFQGPRGLRERHTSPAVQSLVKVWTIFSM